MQLVPAFENSWRNLMDDVLLSSMELKQSVQVMLLLAALPSSWRPFITTQSSVVGLTLDSLISRVLQEDTLRTSTTSASSSIAFTTQRYQHPFTRFNCTRFNCSGERTNTTSSSRNSNQSTSAICDYCGHPGHVERGCRTKKRGSHHFQQTHHAQSTSL
ncbi:hypothetical protein KP509_01G028000 [Ceratopteris richardii]|uniref:CCHC-type domain-containing protein n=1 Tax=Ceratopteris richardii TaxID=49495 RepID=A0A8T2VN96_CERRI|nr:hypothetical protein KP509_01G028000 [Ceratopteris richardii]